jgi:hypothetical protein
MADVSQSDIREPVPGSESASNDALIEFRLFDPGLRYVDGIATVPKSLLFEFQPAFPQATSNIDSMQLASTALEMRRTAQLG